MKRQTCIVLLSAFTLALTISAMIWAGQGHPQPRSNDLNAALEAAQDRDDRVKLEDLPPAAQKTAREQSKGAKIEEITKETVKGKTVYEVEVSAGAVAKAFVIDIDGQVIAVEEQVTFDSLPPAVRAGIERQALSGNHRRSFRHSPIEWFPTDNHASRDDEMRSAQKHDLASFTEQ